VPPQSLAIDSASVRSATQWLDSLKNEHPVELPSPTRVVREVPAERAPVPERPARAITEDPFFIPGSTVPPRRDTVVPRDTAPRPDTARPRPDTTTLPPA
jgi:hypothetical protein